MLLEIVHRAAPCHNVPVTFTLDLMQCALCRGDGPVVSSHIVPEFLYEALYDEKHRFHEISADPERRNRYRQKGLREPLLCESCEQQLSVHEGYMRKLLRGGVRIAVQDEPGFLRVSGLDCKQLKLFQLSVLWRAGVSTLPEFEQVRLGAHEDRIRQMVLAADPGSPLDYGCIMCALLHGETQVQDLFVPPTWARLAGQKAYRFVFGGFVFVYLVASHAPPNAVSVCFAQPDGTALLKLQQIGEIGYLVDTVARLHDLGKLVPT